MSTGHEFISLPPGANRIVALSHIGFALIGIVNTMLGPILPYLFVRWRLDDSQAGLILLVQPASAMLASLASGLFIKRFGFTAPLTLGFGFMAAGAFSLGFGPWWTGVVAISGTGLALGLTIPTINLLISEVNAHRRAAAVNLLNLVWGLGAATGPLLISALVRASGLTAALLFLGAWAAAMAWLMSRGPILSPSVAAPDPEANAPARHAGLGVYLFLTCALVFINVGTESATGGWIAIYVQRLGSASDYAWSLAPSVFWAGMLTGRAAAPLVLQHLSEMKTTLAGMLLAVCGMLVLLSSREPTTAFVGIGLAGFGLGPVFPTTFALFTQRSGGAAAQLTGVLFLLAGLGAAVFPLLVGLLSNHFDGLRAGLLVPLCGGVVMVVLQIAIMLLSTGGGRQRTEPRV